MKKIIKTDQIQKLVKVTQLYVSIDASTEDSLKKIDRPLFKNFWKRFIDSIEAMRASNQRTVFRLTLVKSFNMQEVQFQTNEKILQQNIFVFNFIEKFFGKIL